MNVDVGQLLPITAAWPITYWPCRMYTYDKKCPQQEHHVFEDCNTAPKVWKRSGKLCGLDVEKLRLWIFAIDVKLHHLSKK